MALKKQQLSEMLIEMTTAEKWNGVIPVQYNLGGDGTCTNLVLKMPDMI